jgi:phosphomannomutase/phosphoglucomutase
VTLTIVGKAMPNTFAFDDSALIKATSFRIAGFKKSGHFFLNPSIGRRYDDGLVTAIASGEMLDRNPGKTLAEPYSALPVTSWCPTTSPSRAAIRRSEPTTRHSERN